MILLIYPDGFKIQGNIYHIYSHVYYKSIVDCKNLENVKKFLKCENKVHFRPEEKLQKLSLNEEILEYNLKEVVLKWTEEQNKKNIKL